MSIKKLLLKKYKNISLKIPRQTQNFTSSIVNYKNFPFKNGVPQVKDIMSDFSKKPYYSLDEKESAISALKLMCDKNIGAVIITSQNSDGTKNFNFF